MVFVPEPVRNETNRIAAQQALEQDADERFSHLPVTQEDVSAKQSVGCPTCTRQISPPCKSTNSKLAFLGSGC